MIEPARNIAFRRVRCGRTLLAVATLTLSACASSQAPAGAGAASPGAAGGPRRIQVLFLGHESTHHNSNVYAPMLAQAMAPQGIDVSYTTDPNDLNPEKLALYDALIVYANHNTITTSQEKALLDFVASGKGFLPIHSASYCFRNSAAYVALVGAQFKEHGTGEFTAEITAPQHATMEGIQPFQVWDETYVHDKHNADRTVLMERVDGERREPWTWVRTHGKGRIFYTAYGHDQRVWGHASFQRLMRNAIVWAVPEEVRQGWSQLRLKPLEYGEAAAPIPNYERRDPPPRYQLPLSPTASLDHIQIPPGFELQLFAAEPEIVKPIAMAFDERGRLWVLETVDYPNERKADGQGRDVLRILEDTNGDGRADKSTVFADKLSIPTGLVFIDGGVMVSQAPDFLFLKDTNGDDRADIREKRITGWRTNDTHAGPSNLRYGLDNWLWGTVGYAGFRGTFGSDTVRLSQNVYRFKADGSQLENITNFTNNTWGLGFSENFDVFGSTANNEHSVFVAIPNRYYRGVNGLRGDGRKKIDGHYAMHTITPNLRQVDSQGGYTAAAGHSLYTARSFPREYWNRIALVNEPTGHVVHRARLEPRGSGFAEVDGWNLMASDDEWWAPVHAEVGPDGAVWVLDWYNFIIQHNPRPDGFQMGAGNAYETPLRDKQHGRIYRIAWKGARPHQPMALSRDRPQELVAALRNDNMFWRTTAQRLLVERGLTDVVDALLRIAEDRTVDEIGLNAPAVHALWTLHGLKALDGSNARALDVARRALTHPAAGVRKTALMVLPRTEATMTEMLRAGSLTDANLNTRLSAFLAASEMPASAEVGRLLYTASKDSSNIKDEWLPEALFIAAAKHPAGFLNAYAAEIGASEFARLAARAARGELDTFVDWSAPDLDENGWLTAAVPALWATTRLGPFEGVVWFRREIQLPAGVEAKAATLRLGPVNDGDITYVNGRRIGARADAADAVRQYSVPEGVLRAGRNLIAVRVSNRVGRGGILPDSAGVFLSGDGLRVDLGGDWKYKIEETWAGGRRRDIVAGVPIAQQFLRHHNPVAGIVKPDSVEDATRPARQGPPPNVTRIVLGVLPGRNLFEVTTLTVQPGRQVTFVFNNRDEMPHNVVFFDSTPFEQIESALNAMLSDPDAANRGYVPRGANVLSATPLVQPQQSATITFTAPTTPGDYPFVCTFPGHWLTMRGILRVEL